MILLRKYTRREKKLSSLNNNNTNLSNLFQPTNFEFRDILTSNETRDREKEKKREKENVKLFLLSSPLFTRFLHDVLKKKKKKEEKVCVTTKFSFIFGQSREERSSQFYSSRHDSGCSVFFSPSWIKRRFVFEM